MPFLKAAMEAELLVSSFADLRAIRGLVEFSGTLKATFEYVENPSSEAGLCIAGPIIETIGKPRPVIAEFDGQLEP